MTGKVILSILLLGMVMGVALPITVPGMGEGDFLAYWSASRLLAQGENPYDPDALATLQQAVRPQRYQEQGAVLPAWNPPWLLILFLPISLLPFSIATGVWIACNGILGGMSAALAWGQVVRPFDARGYLFVLFAGLVFPSFLVTVAIGQVTVLVLIGMLSSIVLIQSRREWLAGAALLLCGIKPHLCFLFLAILGFWIIRNRRWKVAGGLAVSLLSSLILVTIFYPAWVSAYRDLLSHMPVADIDTSTLGSFMQQRFGLPYFRWVGILLLVLLIPFTRLVFKNHWLTALNLSTLLTLPFAPYGFGADQVLLLPAMVEITGWLKLKAKQPWQTVLVLSAPILVNLGWLFWMPKNVPNHTLFWIPLAALAVYALVWRLTHR